MGTLGVETLSLHCVDCLLLNFVGNVIYVFTNKTLSSVLLSTANTEENKVQKFSVGLLRDLLPGDAEEVQNVGHHAMNQVAS